MQRLSHKMKQALIKLLHELIDQENARVLVPPNRAEPGFWFGGGNIVRDDTGNIWLGGRYRNYGDSRTGLAAGERGLECTIFRSDDNGETFDKVASWSKSDLSRPDRKVLSIEGTSLHQRNDGTWELYISSEKEMPYPSELSTYQKPGTGVWTIDCMTGASPDTLNIDTLHTVLENHERPEYLHVKDPVVYDDATGNTVLIFCTHPFSWSSSNSGYAVREKGDEAFVLKAWEMVSRGATWDVAATRITARLPVPAIGVFADAPPASIYFYDGAECLRDLDENKHAHKRPRGYSCEELGGALFSWDGESTYSMERLSPLAPLFVSPWGTGCSRYVECMVDDTGIFAVWQQSQVDGSQPFVGRVLAIDRVQEILGA